MADKDRTVFESIENFEGNRCVDLFTRPDGSFGFAEFRRDPEDRGVWTPIQSYAGMIFDSRSAALAAACERIAWLSATLQRRP